MKKRILSHGAILITGGTGTLGKALIHRLSQSISTESYDVFPHKLVVYSRDEGKHIEFASNANVVCEIGDVRDKHRLRQICIKHGVKHIIHTAALKRIDDLERAVSECYRTNVEGTINVVHVADELNIVDVMFISTDKACSPVNAYGASKFMAERYLQKYSTQNATRYHIVRYGNVIDSRGSFIPLWLNKIRNGERIGITSVDCTRFLFTLQDAVDLIMKAYTLDVDRAVIVPNLDSYKIVDVARVLFSMEDAVLDYDVVGIRPGEKIHEEMINETEMARIEIPSSALDVFIIPDTDRIPSPIQSIHLDQAHVNEIVGCAESVLSCAFSSQNLVSDDTQQLRNLIERGIQNA